MGAPMTLEEATKILNVEPINDEGEVDPVAVMEKFEHLFGKNMPDAGGSFYL